MTRRAISCTYIASLIVMVVVGFGYDSFSPGLAERSSNGPFFCKQLMSSGSDDDALLMAFVLFMVPLTIRTLRARRRIAIFEMAVFSLCAFVSCFALWLASLDCASILYTRSSSLTPRLLAPWSHSSFRRPCSYPSVSSNDRIVPPSQPSGQ